MKLSDFKNMDLAVPDLVRTASVPKEISEMARIPQSASIWENDFDESFLYNIWLLSPSGIGEMKIKVNAETHAFYSNESIRKFMFGDGNKPLGACRSSRSHAGGYFEILADAKARIADCPFNAVASSIFRSLGNFTKCFGNYVIVHFDLDGKLHMRPKSMPDLKTVTPVQLRIITESFVRKFMKKDLQISAIHGGADSFQVHIGAFRGQRSAGT